MFISMYIYIYIHMFLYVCWGPPNREPGTYILLLYGAYWVEPRPTKQQFTASGGVPLEFIMSTRWDVLKCAAISQHRNIDFMKEKHRKARLKKIFRAFFDISFWRLRSHEFATKPRIQAWPWDKLTTEGAGKPSGWPCLLVSTTRIISFG